MRLSSAKEVLAFVSDAIGQQVFPTEIGSYLYYNKAGDHLYLHVDTEVFGVNMIIMLRHDFPQGLTEKNSSVLVVY